MAACPELDGDWVDDTVRDPERSYGAVYAAFWHAILPTIAELLGSIDPSQTARSGARPAADDLLRRLYSVIERAAISPDDGLRTAVFIELGEGGYRGLSRADLRRYAGPQTLRLIGTT